jgi:O-antigen ligase
MGLLKWSAGSGVAIDGVLRLAGPHDSPNQTALTLLRSLFVGAGLLLALPALWRRWGALALLPMAVALLLTASRGALLLGLPAGLLTLALLWIVRGEGPVADRILRLSRRRGVRILLLATVILAPLALMAGEARLLNQATVESRVLLWQSALNLWRSIPWTGVGPGGFLWSYPAFLAPGAAVESNLLHPHNLWLEVATGWGTGGLLWLLALLRLWSAAVASSLHTMTRRTQALAVGLSAALVAAVAHGQVDAFLALPELAGWLFVALGLLASLLAISRREARQR